jgi:hypothetical protein
MNEPVAFIYSKKIKKFKKNVVHIWDGVDTFCRMWGTNGILRKERFEITKKYPEDVNREVCTMCTSVLEKQK